MSIWSRTGNGQERVTISNPDGSTRDVTRTSNGSLIVTDTSSSGKQVTGDGASTFGSMTDAVRLNTTSESSGGSGGCMLTTACVSVMGLPDDCAELKILRWLRDNFMLKRSVYREEVAQYYVMAPGIVERINSRSDASRVWVSVYYGLVLPSVKLVKAGDFSGAVAYYKRYAQVLNKSLSVKI